MQFNIIAILATAAAVMAAPTETYGGGSGSTSVCPSGLYSVPQCCAANVLGLAAVDCSSPSSTPSSVSSFESICAATGDKAVCCVVPVAGQDLLCVDP